MVMGTRALGYVALALRVTTRKAKALLTSLVITATSVNNFKNRLDIFCTDQEVSYSYKANITWNRGINKRHS